jgi:hypothetical protein
MDGNRSLTVGGGGEYLALAAGNRSIARDKAGKDAAQGLDAEGQGRYVEKENILNLAA